MRQLNFTLIFVFCLAIVAFGLENTQSVTIRIIEGVEVHPPLVIALVCTLGLGAVLAWVFSVWSNLQSLLSTKKAVQAKDLQLENLQVDLEHYKAELEKQQPLLPGDSSINPES